MTTLTTGKTDVIERVAAYYPEILNGETSGLAYALAAVSNWLSRFIVFMRPSDADLLALWAAHTHVVNELWTTPRLQIDSPMPGSGKTTVLEHLKHLCHKPVQAASVGTPALLARLVADEPRTLLLDEADRTLNAKVEGVGELLAILNAGYKKGATRPVLEQQEGKKWVPVEMSCFAPVALAGNQPLLPDDTQSRIIRVLLLPDLKGQAEESDWELIEDEAKVLGRWLKEALSWCFFDVERPQLPPGCTGRFREKWLPLARVANAASPEWLAKVMVMAAQDVADVAADKEAGLINEKPAIQLLRDILESWPASVEFRSTTDMVRELQMLNPDVWGPSDRFPKGLTVQRFGRMLKDCNNLRSTDKNTADKNSPRGFWRHQFDGVEYLIHPTIEPPEPPEPPIPPENAICLFCGKPATHKAAGYPDQGEPDQVPVCANHALLRAA